MQKSTRATVEQWWQHVFDVDDALWSSTTVLHPHALLGDYEAARDQEWIVSGLNGGRVASNAAMASSLPSVMPMSSSPSSNRQRV